MPLLAHMRENRKRPREDGGAGHAINGSIEQQTEEQKKHSVLLAKIKEVRKRPREEGSFFPEWATYHTKLVTNPNFRGSDF